MNTSNILFILGGAFIGLDKMIQQRMQGASMGFGGKVESKKELAVGDMLALSQPNDLIKFGLIPEFVGRIPIVTALDELTSDDLVRILTEPKNALVKQYQHLLKLDGIELVFEEEALRAAVRIAKKRKTGARGLRAVLEGSLTETMFDAPSWKDVVRVVMTAEAIEKRSAPILQTEGQRSRRSSAA